MAAVAAFRAAAAPFDAAIGAVIAGIGGDHDAAVITFFMGDSARRGRQALDHVGRGAQHDARLADRLMHGFAQRDFHIAGGQCGERRRAPASCARGERQIERLRRAHASISRASCCPEPRATRLSARAIAAATRLGGAHLSGLAHLRRAPRLHI